MGRSCRMFTINGQTFRTGRPKLDRPYAGGERIPGPPYHFNLIIDKEDLEKVQGGGEWVTFEEWGTSCIDCWTWFQHATQVFKTVVFQKYEHYKSDYTSEDEGLLVVYFTADECWQVDPALMEEVPHDKNTDWNKAPRCPPFLSVKERTWDTKRCWKLVDGEWRDIPYEARPATTRTP